MAQINIGSIRTEYDSSTNVERNRLSESYGLADSGIRSTISRIESTGDRMFRSSDEVNTVRNQSLGNRADYAALSFREFATTLRTTGLKPSESTLGGELLSRNLARQIDLPRKEALSLFEAARGSVQKGITDLQKKTTSILSRNVGKMEDNFSPMDPLKQNSQYVFYDAFAVIRGPRKIEIIDFNNDITSASVSISTDISPGNFSITFANDMEQYVDDYGIYTFKTGDTIRIYATKRFDDGGDRYSHIFWGIIERVSDDYSDGSATLTVSGQDITAWLQYTTVRPNPTFLEVTMNPGLDSAHYGHKYAGKNVLEILTDILANDWDFNCGTAFSLQESRVTKEQAEEAVALLRKKEKELSEADRASLARKIDRLEENADESKKSIVQWWRDLFKDELVLKIFGYDGVFNVEETSNAGDAVQQKGLLAETTQLTPAQKEIKIRSIVLNQQSQCNALRVLDKYVPIRIFANQPLAGVIELEDTPKIEVIRQITEGTLFEFFMDRDGSLVFKPPFYNEYPANNDTKRYSQIFQEAECSDSTADRFSGEAEHFDLSTASQYILDEKDILSFSIAEDSTAIITRQEVTGEPRNTESIQEQHWGAFQNNDLLKRYGLRVGSPKKQRMIDNSADAIVYAKGLMDYQNTKFYTGNVTIIGRPELHLGRTVYLTSRNVLFYVTNISHSFTAGSSFTTTLTLVAGRRMFLDGSGNPMPNVFDGEQFLETESENLKKQIKKMEDSSLKGSFAKDIQDAKSKLKDLQDKQSLFNRLRKPGEEFTADEQKKFGFLPRRISDKNGRRIYGTLPYGLFVSPPPPPKKEDQPAQEASKGADPAGESRPGGSTVPSSNGNASGENAASPTSSDPDTRQKQQDTRGGGAPLRTNQTGQPSVFETSKNCSEQRDKKSFNPSNLIAQRRVTGINL